MQINFSGTVDEIIELAEVLRRGRKSLANQKAKKPTVSPDILAAIAKGSLIEAIKIRRAETKCGLREAKDYVEALPQWVAYRAERDRREAEAVRPLREILTEIRPTRDADGMYSQDSSSDEYHPDCSCRGGV